jgi:hypothetical protein
MLCIIDIRKDFAGVRIFFKWFSWNRHEHRFGYEIPPVCVTSEVFEGTVLENLMSLLIT